MKITASMMYKTGNICAIEDTNLVQKPLQQKQQQKEKPSPLPQTWKPQPTDKNTPKPTKTQKKISWMKSLCITLTPNHSWKNEVSLKLFHNQKFQEFFDTLKASSSNCIAEYEPEVPTAEQ